MSTAHPRSQQDAPASLPLRSIDDRDVERTRRYRRSISASRATRVDICRNDRCRRSVQRYRVCCVREE